MADCSRPLGKAIETDNISDPWGTRPTKAVKPEESFHWRRHLLLVKTPDYLVVWDEISSPMPSEWFLHTTASKFIWGQHLITSHTDYNADLDIHVLSPSSTLVPNEKEGVFGQPVAVDPHRPGHMLKKEDPYPFSTLKYFSIPAKPNEDFLTVLHPRKPDGAPLKATLVYSTKEKVALKIVNGARTDLITLSTAGASFQRDDAPPRTMPMEIESLSRK